MRDFEKCSDRHGRKVAYLFASVFLSGFVIWLLWWSYSPFVKDDFLELFRWLLLSVVQPLMVLLVAVALFKDVWKQAFTQFFNDMRHKSLGRFFYTLLAGFIVIGVTIWGIEPLLSGMLKRTSINQQVVVSLARSDISCVFYFIEIVILGPFMEETQFRCGLYRLVRTKSVIAAHVVSALLFGLIHVIVPVIRYGIYEELWFLMNYAFYGFAFSVVYEKTKCLVYPLVLHMLINLVAFIGMYLS